MPMPAVPEKKRRKKKKSVGNTFLVFFGKLYYCTWRKGRVDKSPIVAQLLFSY